MKIQLKRSNVLVDSAAKSPSSEQMDYGEIAVNYNPNDPALFLKDSDDNVIRIAGVGSPGEFSGDYNDLINQPTIGDGNITINAGNGLTANGDNATANQTGETIRTLTAVAGNSSILVDADGIKVQNANITPDYDNITNTPTIGNGGINVNPGNGLTATGTNATANQTDTTTRTLTVAAADNSISVAAGGISVVDANLTPAWGNITGKPSNITGAALSSGSYLTGGPYDGSVAKTFNVDATTAATGSKVVARDGNGDINSRYCVGQYMNMSHARATRNSDSTFYSSTDDYIRKNDAGGMRSSLNVPTRTGGNASGTWGISITGNAATANSATTSGSTSGNAASATIASTVTVNNSDSNSSYRMLWHSGNSIYSTAGVYLNASTDAFYANGWHYTSGSNGFYNNTYGGGWNMSDTTWFRIYNSKALYVSNTIASTGDVYTNYSDMRLKDKVGDIENALDKVCAIDTMLYKHNDIAKSYGYEGDETQVGVTAQSVKEVLPEVIARAPFDIETHETDGTTRSKSGEDYMTVRYERIVPLLIEAIKDLKAELATIKRECKCS